ncbi:response regulator [soil metagenome]
MSVKILVVDDESDVELLFRQRFRKLIKDKEIDFFFAFSGEQALDYLKTLDPLDVALILSDINMPGMSGFELLKKVKDNYPEMRVMMVTAYGDPENQERAKVLGADDLLSKPLDFSLLDEKLANLK